MLSELKIKVCEGNKTLKKEGLVIFTWGNLSAIDRKKGVVAIKPGEVSFEALNPADLVLVDLEGNLIEGDLRPSSDTKTPLEIYKKFEEIGSIVHTHSTNATAFAQAGRSIKCLGTIHADHFYGDVPVVEILSNDKITEDYEKNTEISITSHYSKNNINSLEMPSCLIARHGLFVWRRDIMGAIFNYIILEKVTEIKQKTLSLNKNTETIKKSLLDKHYLRKN